MEKATIAVGNRRLMKLVELLKTVPRKQFNYWKWAGHDWKGKADLSCGTQACALGWATTIPSLRRLGLRLHRPFRASNPFVQLKGAPRLSPYEVAQTLFGLNANQAHYLFTAVSSGEEDDATPKQVAKKLEKFVASRSATAK